MVVANCNASCYWLHVHCSQWLLILFLFYWIEGWFCHHGRLYAVNFETVSQDYSNPQLIAKCEQLLCETSCEWWPSSKAKICCLKSDSLSTIRNNKFITQGEKLETVIAKVRVFVSNISSPPLKRRYKDMGFRFSPTWKTKVSSFHL